MLKIVKRLTTAYTECLKNHPMKVQSIQTGLLLGTGDMVSQLCVENHPYNGFRTMRFTIIGIGLGPILFGWYSFMDNVVGKSSYPVAKKVALDQLVAAPAFLLVVQTTVCASQGKTWDETKEKLGHHFFEILFNNYKLWPLVQVINFSVVPLDYRVLFTQVIGVFWNTYLAYKTHEEVPPAHK